MTFTDFMEGATKTFEVIGVAILAVGSLAGFARFLVGGRGSWRAAYGKLRNDLGRAILLGLEILIVADIVRTITLAPTIENAVTLGIIVLVRTFLSFSLEVELEGVVPWRFAEAKKSGAIVVEE
jgi:uncharacterized membrane protein